MSERGSIDRCSTCGLRPVGLAKMQDELRAEGYRQALVDARTALEAERDQLAPGSGYRRGFQGAIYAIDGLTEGPDDYVP